jgi:hypothetical protein
MAKGKSYMNGIVVGILLAVLALFAATQIEALSFIDTFFTWLVSLFANIEALETVTAWEHAKYLVAGLVGLIIGVWTEYR